MGAAATAAADRRVTSPQQRACRRKAVNEDGIAPFRKVGIRGWSCTDFGYSGAWRPGPLTIPPLCPEAEAAHTAASLSRPSDASSISAGATSGHSFEP